MVGVENKWLNVSANYLYHPGFSLLFSSSSSFLHGCAILLFTLYLYPRSPFFHLPHHFLPASSHSAHSSIMITTNLFVAFTLFVSA
jgi:hypothetical protein